MSLIINLFIFKCDALVIKNFFVLFCLVLFMQKFVGQEYSFDGDLSSGGHENTLDHVFAFLLLRKFGEEIFEKTKNKIK